ncbi:13555_t:CDS:2 [Funneliformis geosporum]|uniref:13555_t:CDS:1 n=1 Tax=Funneliformis geosporum TaxID=1117311 RepID=A0A9W4SAT3_9GLOM|nr:13555_t:CDS:2 [Funneliformis geosporum]
MTTLQEQFEKKFPDKRVGVLIAFFRDENNKFTSYDLDLGEYEKVGIDLISVDFLNQLPNPERLEKLEIYNNNIQPTDIEIFRKFVNLEVLKIGTEREVLSQGKRNRFYGSLKSFQNLTKLKNIFIEATDINEGLEYLPESLIKESKRMGAYSIECSTNDTDAKCKAIQDQLIPFNYDLEAWQLVNNQYPNLTKHIQELSQKITEIKQELQQTKSQEIEKDKKIKILSKETDNLKKEKKTELEQLKKLLKSKLEEKFHDELDALLDANEEYIKNDNNFAKRQFERSKKKLIEKGNLDEQEVVNVCEIQKELVKLAVGIENQLEAKIEIN